jgi:hypothetical protein
LGKCVATQNTSGSHSRPHHLTELNTVIAIACPSMFPERVPVAVIGAGGRLAVLTRVNLMARIVEVKRI